MMASLPVPWIADTMTDGAALPVTVRIWSSTEAETSLIPDGQQNSSSL
jgi:hypothetical protein